MPFKEVRLLCMLLKRRVVCKDEEFLVRGFPATPASILEFSFLVTVVVSELGREASCNDSDSRVVAILI